MLQTFIGIAIILLVYVCLGIILLAPTLYVGWIAYISRKIPGLSKISIRTLVLTVGVNLIVAGFAVKLAHNYFQISAAAKYDSMAEETLKKVIAIEGEHLQRYGRYSSIGPLRGPVRTEDGLVVPKDVIAQVDPAWDKKAGQETFSASALHVWGTRVVRGGPDGITQAIPVDEDRGAAIRSRLINSVK